MSACVTTGMVSAPDNLQLKWKKKKKNSNTTKKNPNPKKDNVFMCIKID